MEDGAISDSAKIYDCIVVGGGISGISFAHYLHSEGKSVLVLEKEDRVGGQIYTHSSNNYWRELGAHTCYNSYTKLLDILTEIDGRDSILGLEKYGYKLYCKGKVRGVFSEISLFQLFINGVKIFFSKKENRTVKQYFQPIVGKSNYTKVFSNLFKAVICQNADNYPAELFLKKRKERLKEIPRKFSFAQGISSFLDLIIEKDKLKVEKSIEVVNIETENSVLKIETKQGQIYYAKNVALASDPQSAAAVLRNMNNSLSDLLASIPLFHSESINITLKKDKISIAKVAGIIPVFDPFMSVVSRDLVEHPDMRSFTFHFEKGQINDEEQMDMICKVLNISKADILESKKVRHALPSLSIRHLRMDEQVQKVQSKNIYILGNYFLGLSLEDCVQRSLVEFERYKSEV